jgi:putative ABC transport system permease protein
MSIAWSLSELTALRNLTSALSQIATYGGRTTAVLSGRDDAIRLDGSLVSAALFPLLGAQPLLGRAFDQRENDQGADGVVIFSYAAWQRYFGGDANIVGRVVALDGRNRIVVGVMAQGFAFPDDQAQF